MTGGFHRNFGLTSRATFGGDKPHGSLDSKYALSELSTLQASGSPFESSEISEPALHQRKLPPGFLFIAAIASQFIAALVIGSFVFLFVEFR